MKSLLVFPSKYHCLNLKHLLDYIFFILFSCIVFVLFSIPGHLKSPVLKQTGVKNDLKDARCEKIILKKLTLWLSWTVLILYLLECKKAVNLDWPCQTCTFYPGGMPFTKLVSSVGQYISVCWEKWVFILFSPECWNVLLMLKTSHL